MSGRMKKLKAVTPVTRGTRYSLVAWNWGWPFQ